MKRVCFVITIWLCLLSPVFSELSLNLNGSNQDLFGLNEDGTPSQIALNTMYSRWGEMHGFVEPTGSGLVGEFYYGLCRGIVRLLQGYAECTKNTRMLYRVDGYKSEHQHWKTSKRKSMFENVTNIVGYYLGLSLPLTIWFIPILSVHICREARHLSNIFKGYISKIPDYRDNLNELQRIVVGASVPILLFIISWGIMASIDNSSNPNEWGWNFHPTCIDDSWWGWLIYISSCVYFLIYWFKSNTSAK